ncbi:hypothetical protein EYF80_066938 [Liparis tanakae]|uniref:Secreted protein n=1 Tax=Liparis tanakae TaxID=230148 RepID=A0A4Z2E239_9TELE|nr:hypothetical protein EYF80_066938 [Liparis tanakae]
MSIMLIMMFLWVFLYFPTRRDTVSQPGRPVHMWVFPPSFFHSRTWQVDNGREDVSDFTARLKPLTVYLGGPTWVVLLLDSSSTRRSRGRGSDRFTSTSRFLSLSF